MLAIFLLICALTGLRSLCLMVFADFLEERICRICANWCIWTTWHRRWRWLTRAHWISPSTVHSGARHWYSRWFLQAAKLSNWIGRTWLPCATLPFLVANCSWSSCPTFIRQEHIHLLRGNFGSLSHHSFWGHQAQPTIRHAAIDEEHDAIHALDCSAAGILQSIDSAATWPGWHCRILSSDLFFGIRICSAFHFHHG